ncbi:hypothetical protein Dsin_025289 [Dipteronia sinensis]|uniref:Uncharacterized protein n=1 Tax=Dipteronia sinensis TaxID=43782 RepID=A0AAD9ZWN6_9ROSI|nr:hypothetical protein Dsin_025289 [Dipteronia sinensis]
MTKSDDDDRKREDYRKPDRCSNSPARTVAAMTMTTHTFSPSLSFRLTVGVLFGLRVVVDAACAGACFSYRVVEETFIMGPGGPGGGGGGPGGGGGGPGGGGGGWGGGPGGGGGWGGGPGGGPGGPGWGGPGWGPGAGGPWGGGGGGFFPGPGGFLGGCADGLCSMISSL